MEQTYLWIIFGVVFVAAMVLDLFVFQRKAHAIPVKEALKLVGFWISLAIIFNVVVYFTEGSSKALEFTTAYLIEYSLSIDNLFVFLAIFTYFAVPRESHRKVLLWGILGALFFRGVFIFAGIELLERFHFLIFVLGALLVFTGIRLLRQKDEEVHPEKNFMVRLVRRFVRCEPKYIENRFFVRLSGLLYITPLFLVLVSIETMDIMFAVDSVPAVLSITLDPFIVYTSNIFAILGLRALFFAISGLFYLFRYLVHGLSIVLLFVGVKMLVSDWYKMPVYLSLGVVATLIVGSIVASVLFPKKEVPAELAVGGEICETEEKTNGRKKTAPRDGESAFSPEIRGMVVVFLAWQAEQKFLYSPPLKATTSSLSLLLDAAYDDPFPELGMADTVA
jgi:tellurite resistance protein TerC